MGHGKSSYQGCHVSYPLFVTIYIVSFLHHILELNLILFFLKYDGISQTIDKLTNRTRNAREYD
jgi:hypothetical protein